MHSTICATPHHMAPPVFRTYQEEQASSMFDMRMHQSVPRAARSIENKSIYLANTLQWISPKQIRGQS